ncbi:hypothetical protein ACF5W4_11210 [Bacillota bacterium Lsc_1132]
MGKVIEFKTKDQQGQESLVRRLEELVEMAKAGEVKDFVLAGHSTDGTVLTGFSNAEINQRQELISHLQVDVVYEVCRINILEELAGIE